MKTLTFLFDCEINDDSDFIKSGTVVEMDETAPKYTGFTAVMITEGFNNDGEPIQFIPFSDHFSNACFAELS
jgi:hypothetical protein